VEISDELYKEIIKYSNAIAVSELFTGKTLADLARWYKTPGSASESEKMAWGQQLQEFVRTSLLSEREGNDSDFTEESEGLAKLIPSYYFEKTVELILHFFTTSIRYLGPLRADPGTIQQRFAPASELDNVGTRGEYSAIVYHANKHMPVT